MGRDERIYHDFKEGNINTLYAEFYSSMMAYAARFLTNEYAMMAEDCVQESIVKAYNTRDTFVSPSQLKSFLFTCIHNGCVSVLRRVSTHQGYTELPREEVEQEISASLIEQETIDMLHAAIHELPEKYQQIFELNFEQGLKNEEAARLLNISLNGFNKRKAKMISLLRERFKDNEMMQLLITIMTI
ncbi:MAG: sigma-70 family RNA polymerase sigma factor [Prevotella sp.]|nr:sigma-70 family RNA polymerase sigma factor [Prevotella sp.]MBR1462277.1 sigma-70 family RNA polymerase sigma factor [Prevotella sp.]